ncbi:hypothetical protein [Streptomyces sp. G45]|uniref:hypothetical protein n=1 Tax=Streptomyces sp. G45 TaxID=3406627 RepID=UPI003C19E700
MTREPQPDHVGRLVQAAFDHPEIAHRFANGYADPLTYRAWMLAPEGAKAYLSRFGQ